MMVQKIIIFSLAILFCLTTVNGQELTFGFKAGLNFARIGTEDIEQLNDEDLEEFGQNSGFHLGIVVNNKFSDIFGARAEILFSQKGGRYQYEGPSYTSLISVLSEELVTREGDRDMTLNISNTYIDIPFSVYVRPVTWLEVSAGFNVAFLAASTASGELAFRENSQNEDDAFRGINLDYRYFRDEVGQSVSEDGSEVRKINGTSFEIPKTIKAYYDFPVGSEIGLYNRIDFGLHGTINFYINKSLFVGARFNYGLTDVTDERVDRSLLAKDGDELIFRDDYDRNVSIQASIGFSF